MRKVSIISDIAFNIQVAKTKKEKSEQTKNSDKEEEKEAGEKSITNA